MKPNRWIGGAPRLFDYWCALQRGCTSAECRCPPAILNQTVLAGEHGSVAPWNRAATELLCPVRRPLSAVRITSQNRVARLNAGPTPRLSETFGGSYNRMMTTTDRETRDRCPARRDAFDAIVDRLRELQIRYAEDLDSLIELDCAPRPGVPTNAD